MRIVFFGNSKYSSLVAKTLNDKFGLSLVVTNPDKLGGRNRQLIVSPVKQFSQNNRIPFLTFKKLDQKAIEAIAKYRPDFLVVADYGLILPGKLLDLPKYAALNVHHSLLPKYRGPSPIQTAILAGEKKTGVSIILMDDEIDHGPILAREKITIAVDDSHKSLEEYLGRIGAKLLIKTLSDYLAGKIKPKPQNHKQAAYTKLIKKTDGYIYLKDPPDPQTFDRMIRAYYPWPGVWSKWKMENGKWKIIKFLPRNLIQPEGKKPMTVKEFLNGYPETKDLIDKIYPIPTTRNRVRP